MDWVGVPQSVEVPALLRLAREVVAVGRVVISKGTTNRFGSQFVVDAAEQTTTDDLESLLGTYRFPQRMNAPEVVRQRCQCFYAALASRFLVRLWQRSQQHGGRHGFQRFGQCLHKAQVGIEAAAGQCLAFFKLAHVGDQLVDQDHARCVATEQCFEHCLAG